jgi:dihydroorotate dehydrogenase (fumarate)
MSKDGCQGSINSEGLPNQGIDYYISAKVCDGVKETGKPYIVSISGLKLADNLEMLSRISSSHAAGCNIAAVELNLACPNIPGKPTIAYDFEQMRDILKQVTDHETFRASGLPLGIKLAPYFDIPHYEMATEIINSHKDRIRFVVTMNTIGNALLVDGESEMALIKPKSGYGGLGGGFTKQIALANVRQLSQRLAPEIDVVGVGGIATGMDAFEMVLCGAKAVQVATTHWLEGPECFDRIAKELESIMKRKGYTSISDYRGKLKEFDHKSYKASEKLGKSEKTPSARSLLLAGALPILLFAGIAFVKNIR